MPVAGAASVSVVPNELRHLRACLFCALIKTLEQFKVDGCDNCEEFLQLREDHDKILECTSSNFDGMICMMNFEDSWVSKWQRIPEDNVKGIYAVSVTGRLPEGVIRELSRQGIQYRTRDNSAKLS